MENDFQEANKKLFDLEGFLTQANATISSTEIRLKEATDKLQNSEEEKILLSQKLENTDTKSQDKVLKLKGENSFDATVAPILKCCYQD